MHFYISERLRVKDKFLFILLVVLVSITFWQWFLPEPKVANDFPIISDSYLKSLMDAPRLWTDRGGEGLGQYSIFSLWAYPASFLMGALANLNLGFSILERIFFIIPFIILGSLGVWGYLGFFGLSREGRFFGSLFYLINTYIILIIDGGQLLISLAYAAFPFTLLAVEKGVTGGWNQKVIAGLAVSLLGFLDIRFVFVLFVFCLIRFLYGFLKRETDRKSWVKGWFETGIISLLIFIGLNAFWIVPFIKVPIESEVFARLTQMSAVTSANLGHSLLLISPHWFKNIFGQISPLRAEFILIPVLVFLAPVVRKKYYVGLWVLVAVVALFLSKGSAEPLGEVYLWLYANVPGFSLFRDSTKFFFLVAISFAYLIGVSLDWLFSRYKKGKIFLFLLFTFYFFFLIRPVFLNQMQGTLSSPDFVKEYSQVADILKEDKEFSRVVWLPATQPLSYSDPTHPVLDGLRLTEKRPFAQGIKGSYEILNFLREAPYMGELFDVFSIGYIVYPVPDAGRGNVSPDDIKYHQVFLNQLSQLPWVSKVQNTQIPVLKVKENKSKFFLANNVWWVIGSDKVYEESTKSAKLALKDNALIFAEEKAGLGQRLEELSFAKIVLFNKTLTDLAAGFINEKKLIFPAAQLSRDPNQAGWWKREGKELINWRYFLKDKYGIDNQDFDMGGGWAVGEKNLKFEILLPKGAPNLKFRKENILLARVMESSKSGSLSFQQNGEEIGRVVTKNDGDANVRWFEVGKLSSDDQLVINTEGDINVVNALAVLDEKEWINKQEEAKRYRGKIIDFNQNNLTEEKTRTITYKEVNPTKYIVTVQGLTGQAFLVFSQTFDQNWKMNGQSPYPAYSLLNGYPIDKDGVYEVNFDPQKYVGMGAIISIISLLILGGYFLFRWKR